MKVVAKRCTIVLLALAMIFTLMPMASGPVYAADEVTLPSGEVQASTLEEGHTYLVPSGGTTIVLQAGDDVTVDCITTRTNGVLTIKGDDSGKLTVTGGINMPYSGNGLIVEGGTLVVDVTGTNSTGWEFALTCSHYDQHGGNVTAKLTNDTGINCGLFANYGFYMDGGTLTASGESSDTIAYGIICEGADYGRVVVEGGKINSSASGNSAYAIKAQYLDIKGGEIIAKADAAGGAYGFFPNTFKGSTFTMTDGKLDMTVNGNSGASLLSYQDVTINGGQLTGTVSSSYNFAYGVDCSGQDADFTMTGGTLDITAINGANYDAYGLRIDNANVTGGTIITNVPEGYEASGIKVNNKAAGAELNFTNATLDLTSTGRNTYGILSLIPVNITGGKVTTEVHSRGDTTAAGLYVMNDLTLSGTEVRVVSEGEQYNNGIYVQGSTNISESLVDIKTTATEKGGEGACFYKDLTMNGVTLDIKVKSAGEAAFGITTGSGPEDWNVKESAIDIDVTSTSSGDFGCKAMEIYHEPGESTATFTDSLVSVKCSAPGAHGEAITCLSDMVLRGVTEIEAIGIGNNNAHGVYVRGSLTMGGANTMIYGKGTTDSGYAGGIRADGGIRGAYTVTLPEGGYVEDGRVNESMGGEASEAKLEGIASEHLRVYGTSRYETAYSAASLFKELKGKEKLPTVIVADGRNFADALSGSYLAAVAEAPILLVHPKYEEEVFYYLQGNVETGGKVYLLGGEGAVSADFEKMLNVAGYNVIRLGGTDRFDTNVLILKEANGIDSTYAKQMLVCSGMGFADALSTSSVGRPILLVGKTLSTSQKEYLDDLKPDSSYIVGGTGAVSEEVEAELAGYIPAESTIRLNGNDRFETSYMVANTFFPWGHRNAVMVDALNFPDGLSGGAVAAAISAPVLLCTSKEANNAQARKWVEQSGAFNSVTFGGPTLISGEQIKYVMGQPDAEIVVYGS